MRPSFITCGVWSLSVLPDTRRTFDPSRLQTYSRPDGCFWQTTRVPARVETNIISPLGRAVGDMSLCEPLVICLRPFPSTPIS